MQLRLALGVFVGIVKGLDRGVNVLKTAGFDRASAVLIKAWTFRLFLGSCSFAWGAQGSQGLESRASWDYWVCVERVVGVLGIRAFPGSGSGSASERKVSGPEALL